ncbi:BQ5605_C029g10683 [Microbotryum silenes-dioicae]|uniref:BQ5605_C029g10683 protein n=1 Tax=Microbotryum silenes-dioicae TaxID=796604 RepID=A0A2X0MJ92_9BASI|nr:BQ5605_C029g10683 [Microbotryum silenes-dioicae]
MTHRTLCPNTLSEHIRQQKRRERVIIPFRTVLGLELIGCWRKMRCHFTEIFLCGFGRQRWTSVQRLFRVSR